MDDKIVSVICNNCISVAFYRVYKTQYYSPTTNMHFDSKDFVTLCKNFKHYINKEVTFPGIEHFKSYQYYTSYKKTNKPVGLLDDIALFFLHYNSEQEAKQKWIRRTKRVDLSKLMFVMAEDESSDYKSIMEFTKLQIPNKICLTFNNYDIDGILYRPDLRNELNTGWDVDNYLKFKEIANNAYKKMFNRNIYN